MHTKALATALASLALASPALAGWGSASDSYATMRIEGGTDLGKNIRIYGFADMTPAEFGFGDTYAEFRLMRPLAGGLSGLVEYNGDLDEDTVRAGMQWNGSLANGNTTSLRGTYSDDGPQLGVYTRQQLTRRLAASFLAEINEGSVYSEVELEARLTDNLGAFAQARIFDDGARSATYFVGGRFGF